MKYDRVIISLKKGQMPVREFEISPSDWDLVFDALIHYRNASEKLLEELLDKRFSSLAENCHTLIIDLADLKGKIE